MIEYEECVLCGATPTTVEDVVPDWLRKSWKVSAKARLIRGLEYPDRIEVQGTPQPVQLVRLQFKGLCESCNGTRLGGLETAVVPHLRPIVDDERERNEDERRQESLCHIG